MIHYKVLSKESAITKLNGRDHFVDSLNLSNLNYYIYDFKSKRDDLKVEDYLKLVEDSIIDPEPEFVDRIDKIMKKINSRWVDLNFKEIEINFIRTTGSEAFFLPYTRGNSIIIPSKTYKSNRSVLDGLTIDLIWHELFHILSRNNESMRLEMYQFFKFSQTSNQMRDEMILNPDCPNYNYGIWVKHRGEDKFGVPNIHIFENRLEWNCLWVESDQTYIHVADTDLFKQIGTNTKYISHPEEICAEHFRLVMDDSWNLSINFKNKQILSDFLVIVSNHLKR